MAVSEDEIVYLGMRFEIFLGIEHQVFSVLAHVRRLFAVNALHAAVLCPVKAEIYSPARMNSSEQQPSQELELLVVVAQSVAVRKKEHLAVYLGYDFLSVHNHATLLFEVVAAPDVVVSGKEVDLHAVVCQLANLAKESGISLWYNEFVFEPEVEHVAKEIHRACLVLDAVEESDKSALLHPSVRNGS